MWVWIKRSNPESSVLTVIASNSASLLEDTEQQSAAIGKNSRKRSDLILGRKELFKVLIFLTGAVRN